MTHIHRRFSDDQVKHLFRLYVEGQMDRTQVEETLKIGKTRFFLFSSFTGVIHALFPFGIDVI